MTAINKKASDVWHNRTHTSHFGEGVFSIFRSESFNELVLQPLCFILEVTKINDGFVSFPRQYLVFRTQSLQILSELIQLSLDIYKRRICFGVWAQYDCLEGIHLMSLQTRSP